MIKIIRLIFLIFIIFLNCEDKTNDNFEIRIKKYIAKSAEERVGFKSNLYEHYELTKLSFDTSLVKYDIYKAIFTLASPITEFHVAYHKGTDEIIDLGIFQNNNPIGFSKIIKYKNLQSQSDIEKILTYYFEIYDEGDVLNGISDIIGINKNNELKDIIKPMEITLKNDIWEISLFTWSSKSGKILKHNIIVDKKNGFKDNIEIIAEDVGNWKAPM
ncbi:hypothetical protein GF337_08930 [candidate division KSB1 bacterium]|nr:hypothetical protein [candidate division KSB1 bacterium]